LISRGNLLKHGTLKALIYFENKNISEGKLENGDGIFVHFDDKGLKFAECEFKNGKPY
jgi:hypothetical protein